MAVRRNSALTALVRSLPVSIRLRMPAITALHASVNQRGSADGRKRLSLRHVLQILLLKQVSMDEATIARLEELLKNTLEVAEENNRILLAMQRSARWAFWGKVLLWVVVLALPFIFLGPLIHTLVPLSNTGSTSGSFFGLPSPEHLQDALKAYQQ